MNQTTERVLAMLLSRGPLSGEAIASELNITRAAVWKHITELRTLGFGIESSTGKGYTLSHVPDSLEGPLVHRYMDAQLLGAEIIYHEQCGSTNTELKTLAESGAKEGLVVVANEQLAGRGRRGRTWLADKDEALLFSVLLRPPLPPAELAGLTLMAGVAVVEALITLGVSATLKWPNDVHISGKKACGILTEASGELDHTNYVILGVGLNVKGSPVSTDFPSTSLAAAGAVNPRAQVLAELLKHLEINYTMFLERRVTEILDKWRSYSHTLGRAVTAHTSQGSFSGIAKDITMQGALVITLDTGEERVVNAGDVSIR